MALLGAIIGGASGAAVLNIVINGIDNFSKTFTKAGVGIKTLGLGLTALGVAGAIGIGLLVKKAAKLETAFRNVDVILGETGAAEERFGQTVRDLSSELPIQGGRISVLSGLYEVISAGITDTADVTNLLTTATQQAVAGNVDMSISVKALTSIMRGFGMEFSQANLVSSKLFRTVDLGQITFEEISTTIGRLIPFADSLGISLDELLAGMSSLSGVTGDANEVSTQFRSIMGALIKPTQDMQDIIAQLGFETGAAAIAQLGFLGTLNAIAGAAENSNANIGKILGRKEALTAFFAVTGASGDTYVKNLEEIGAAQDLLAEKIGIATDSMEADWRTAINNINIILEDFGGEFKDAVAPAISAVAIALQDLTTFLDTDFGKTLVGVIAIFTLLGIGIAIVVGVILLLATTTGAFVGVVILAIIVLNGFWRFMKAAMPSIKRIVISSINGIVTAFEFMVNKIIQGVNAIRSFLGFSEVAEVSFGRLATPRAPETPGEVAAGLLVGASANPFAGIGVGGARIFNIRIEQIFGTDPEEISKALSDELSAKTTL